MTSTETVTLQSLIAALDEDDTQDALNLSVLADWYEERGNPLSVGLRRIVKEGKRPWDHDKDRSTLCGKRRMERSGEVNFSWYDYSSIDHYDKFTQDVGDCISSLKGITPQAHDFAVDYCERSEAFLDLARVYAAEEK